MKRLAIIVLVMASACLDATDLKSDPSTGATADAAVDKHDDAVPVACDGALCNTSNGSACNAGGDPTLAGTLLAIAALARARSRKRVT
jgi:hypothetical protein